jgi:hypothetical protein
VACSPASSRSEPRAAAASLNGTDYVVHGTFSATMIGDDAGIGTAELAVNF